MIVDEDVFRVGRYCEWFRLLTGIMFEFWT